MTAAGTTPWRIDPLDPATASEADLASVYALEAALEREALPGEPVYPFALALGEYRRSPSYTRRRWFVARQAGEIIGRATCSWKDLPENRTHCEAYVEVAPAARRQGLGSSLFDLVLQAAAGWEATIVDVYARVGGPAEPFLRSMGGERRQIERRSVCRIHQLDRDMLTGWVRRAGERAADYSLVGWDGPCPDDLVEAFCDLMAVMNTAPRDALDWDDDRITPNQLREREALRVEQGYDRWTLCARHNPSGELAGFTEVLLPRLWPEMAYQHDTGVWPKHRERGLGRWLKAAMALRLTDERPAVARIETWNAGSNQAMLAINEAMGFVGLENWGAWQLPAATR